MIWHVLTVVTRQELTIASELERIGIGTCVPYETTAKRTKKGGIVDADRALFPGYVIAGFRRPPPWQSIAKINDVTGKLAIDGRPLIVPPRIVADLMDLTDIIARQKADQAARKPTLRSGGHAIVRGGVHAGQCVKIEIIRGKRAWLDTIHGATRVSISVDALEPV